VLSHSKGLPFLLAPYEAGWNCSRDFDFGTLPPSNPRPGYATGTIRFAALDSGRLIERPSVMRYRRQPYVPAAVEIVSIS
jgi:hypothetical protein